MGQTAGKHRMMEELESGVGNQDLWGCKASRAEELLSSFWRNVYTHPLELDQTVDSALMLDNLVKGERQHLLLPPK